MKELKDDKPDESLKKFCIFAVGDTFGNVGLFKESIVESGKKSEPLFVYRNTETVYSIESLSYDPSGKMLIASTTKHFVILFYLGNFEFLKKNIQKISPEEYFKQNHLISNRQKFSGTLTYKNLNENLQKRQMPKPVEQPVNKMNKPVFYRKGAKQTLIVKAKPVEQSSSFPLEKMTTKPGTFLLKNEKSSFLKDKSKPRFVSVVNFLKPILPLVADKVLTFDGGSLIYSISVGDTLAGRNSSVKAPPFPPFGLIQGNSSGFFDFNSTKSSLKLILKNADLVQWEKKFDGVLQAVEVNSQFVVFLDSQSKVTVLRTSSGRKALFSFKSFNLFKVLLSEDNSLLLVRRNGFFSVLDLLSQSVKFSGNCFDLLKLSQEDPDSLLSHDQVRFLLGEKQSVFLKIFKSLYIYSQGLQCWQSISNTIFYTAFEGQPKRIKEFDLPLFPNDPGEIFDTTPFELIQASTEVSKR